VHLGLMVIPFNPPSVESSFRSLLKPLTTKRKRRGESGHPCLRPHSALKKGDPEPLIRIGKDVVLIQFMTQVKKE
jgi:hypothetical protein